MRVFKEFNQTMKCPICGTVDEGEAVLIAKDGTRDGAIEEAMQVHLTCLQLRLMDHNQQVNPNARIIYQFFDEK
jgi:hypothetical protein